MASSPEAPKSGAERPPAEALYHPRILAHARQPSRLGHLDDATHRGEGRNRPCGDTLTLALVVTAEQVVRVRFTGEGCALCMAAASALCDAVEGVSVERARAIAVDLVTVLTNVVADSPDQAPVLVGDLALFTVVQDFPARRGCASLAAEVLVGALAP